MRTKLTGALALLLIGGCGRSKSSGTNDGTTTTTTETTGADGTLLLGDPVVAAGVVAVQVDSGISAAATEADSSTASSLDLTDKVNTFDRSRACAVQDKTAVVTVTQNVKRDYTFTGLKRTLTNDFEAYYSETRTWSKDGSSVACNANGKSAAVAVKDLAGVSLAVKTEEDRSRSLSLTNAKTGKTTTLTRKSTLSGTRDVAWKSVDATGGDYVLEKTVSHALTQTVELTKKDGTTTSLSSTSTTSAGAPLKIQVVRDQTTLAVVKRIIESGEVDATFKDGTKVSTTFANVEYDATSDSACVPVSGTISGSVTPTGGTAVTYQVAFGDDPTITFSNGQTSDYTPDGCAFEQDPSKAVDKASADVQKPADVTPAAPAADQ